MTGDQLRRPLNAPPAASMAPGIQPGAPGVINAILVIVSGPGGGVFVYDPAPGAGNLIASMTDAAADPFGNVTEKGTSAYVTAGGLRYAVNLNINSISGDAGLSIQDTAHPPAAPPGVYGEGSGTAGSSLAVALLDSGIVDITDADAVVSAQSQTHSSIPDGLIELLAGQITIGNTPTAVINDSTGAVELLQLVAAPAAVAGAQLYANANGTPSAADQGGWSGGIPVTKTSVTATSVGNTASAGDITATYTIPANSGAKGTLYTLRAHARVNTGQTTIETLTLGVDMNGVKTTLATLGTAFNGGALNTSYDIPLELTVAVDAIGASIPEVDLNGGGLGDLSANRLATNSANLPGHADATSWDPASSNTLAIYAQWGGTGGSDQVIKTNWSELTRTGS